MKTIAISACLLGQKCRYDGSDNLNVSLLESLQEVEVIAFCPEDFAFGTPRPTMDLIGSSSKYKAVCNLTQEDLSLPILSYAQTFFKTYPKIDLLIGKDRSPSCGVSSAKLYNKDKHLIKHTAGLMVKEALAQNIRCIDAEDFTAIHLN